MGRRRAVWGFVSIERQPVRPRSETGFEDFLVRHDDKSAGMSGKSRSAGPWAGLWSASSAADFARCARPSTRNEYRVFFYIEREQVVVVHSTMVLVHGINKKTPAADLALAQRRMKEGT